MMQKCFLTLFLLCVSVTANAIPIFNISGDTTDSGGYTHEFDADSVVFNSNQGFSLDKMESSKIGLFSTGILAYFNGFSSYLWQSDIGTSKIVNSRRKNKIRYEKEAFILDSASGNILLSGLLSVNSGWDKRSEHGKFRMNFSANDDYVASVPEPSTMWLLAIGLIGTITLTGKSKKASS